MFKYSKRSLDRLSTAHLILQDVFKEAIKTSPIDITIVEAHRSVERQSRLYRQGASLIDGITRKGYHNYFPSYAVDFCAYINGSTSWKAEHLAMIAGHILAVAHNMGYTLQSGGLWRRLTDWPHIQLHRKHWD